MNLPQLSTATAQEIIDHELKRAMRHEQCDRCARQDYLTSRLQMVIEKLVEQRDRLTLKAMK